LSKVLITDATYAHIAPAVDKVFATFPQPVAGKRVVLKPNVLRRSEPEAAVTTHPTLVKAVIAKLLALGAREVLVGDNPGGGGHAAGNEAAFRASGLWEAAGPHYINFGKSGAEVRLRGEIKDRVTVSRAILDADLVISLPKFKTHGLTGLSCAIKNSFGFLPGGQKGQAHVLAGTPYRFAQLLVDIYAVRPPDLVIVDGVLAMQGNGPAARDLYYLGKVLAGTDGVAVDRVVAEMMGIPPELLRTVEYAAELGLGQSDLSKIEVIGELRPIEGFRVPRRFTAGDAAALHERAGWDPRPPLPVFDPQSCNGCQTCIAECPAGALSFGDLPEVDASRCVSCFCCQELCPTGAVQLGQTDRDGVPTTTRTRVPF
jgi:uncharacterized protein (DUF362 family)/Pyruvate/2-oxoacid:ferredoxin oxidoreductase delta subunit